MRKTYKAGLHGLMLLCMAVWAVTALAVLTVTATPARAQEGAGMNTEKNRAQLVQFAANNMSFDTQVSTAARFMYRRQINSCNTIEQFVRQVPTPYGFIAFPAVETNDSFPIPASGIWAEHVKIRGCGKIWQINMLAVARNQKRPMLLALLPGDTLSDPSAQRSAEHIAAIAISRTDATCAATATPTYTRVLGFRQPNGTMDKTDASLGWYEEWTFDFCQKTATTQVVFMPDGSGGYDIKARVLGATPPQVPQSKPLTPATPAPAQPAADPALTGNLTR